MRNKSVGNLIKNKRLAKNISTKEMAKHLIASEAKYLRYERGEVSVYLNDLLIIADVLDMSPQEIINAYSK